MTSRRSRKSKADVSESEDEPHQSPSQPQESQDHIIQAARDLVSTYNTRRENKRKAIEAEHEKCMKDLEARIDTLSKSKRGRITKSQKVLWDRLGVLNKTRQALETQIIASMKLIESHTLNISNQIEAMYEGRIDDIRMQTAEPVIVSKQAAVQKASSNQT